VAGPRRVFFLLGESCGTCASLRDGEECAQNVDCAVLDILPLPLLLEADDLQPLSSALALAVRLLGSISKLT